jgi:hypothetical protein
MLRSVSSLPTVPPFLCSERQAIFPFGITRIGILRGTKRQVDKAGVIAEICEALERDVEEARQLLRKSYPFTAIKTSTRVYSAIECTQIFVRDGFIDRYSGQRLVFPAALRLLALQLLPDFPFHAHWKMEETHPAFWELYPTIDHLIPVTRGGRDEPANWVTTSQLRNSAKSNWTVDELGWRLLPPGRLEEWDGLMRWSVRFADERPELRRDRYVGTWLRAAATCLT